MIIKYIHSSEPGIEKFYDTEKAYKNTPFFFGQLRVLLEDFEKAEIDRFERDKQNGVILSYEIVKEGESK